MQHEQPAVRCMTCRSEVHDNDYCGYCGQRTRRRSDSSIGTIIDDAYRIDALIARLQHRAGIKGH